MCEADRVVAGDTDDVGIGVVGNGKPDRRGTLLLLGVFATVRSRNRWLLPGSQVRAAFATVVRPDDIPESADRNLVSGAAAVFVAIETAGAKFAVVVAGLGAFVIGCGPPFVGFGAD